jgi:benzoate/toluate 1,2-dioxygenase subunit alpha
MTFSCSIDELRTKVDDALDIDAARGVYRGRRDAYTDPDIFELEMRHIFEGNWIYLAHESQLPNNGDYLTVNMGRQPVVLTRDRNGGLNALINACSHKGAMLCRRKKDNRATFTCPFHGWTFNNAGKLLKVKDPRGAGYPETFKTDGSHDLTRVPRFESYRGFLFGSLNPDVPELKDHLGGAAKIIDMIADQSPEGVEVLRGSSTYTYDGNWKVQAENGADGYHVSAVHWNYAATTARRSSGESATETKAMDAGQWGKLRGGYYAWEKGHVLLWNEWGNPEDRPLWGRRDDFAQQYGQAYASGTPAISASTRTSTSWTSSVRRSGTSTRSRWTRPRSPSTASPPRVRAPRPGRPASASTRTSSTPAAWPPRTTSRSSAPARRPTWPPRRPGTT